MSQPCGCCAGIQVVTPQSEINPPGMSSIRYRVGTYATFYETMLARLSTLYPNVPAGHGAAAAPATPPLQRLTTRDPSDPSIALLDAWAVVADVLTFYQERIANEGYLPTAIERRSLLELARLVNYKLRPGVAASVYLAFTVQSGFSGTFPAGTRAQSMPGSGQMPQFYETSADLAVSAAWNNLQPRLTHPQVVSADDLSKATPGSPHTVYFQGISTNLKIGDGVIIDAGTLQALRLVHAVTPQPNDQRTKVVLRAYSTSQATPVSAAFAQPAMKVVAPAQPPPALVSIDNIIGQLSLPPSRQPRSSISLGRTVSQAFAAQSDTAPRLLAAFHPAAASTLYEAWAGIKPTADLPSTFYAARVKAGIFANNFAGAVSVTETRGGGADHGDSTSSITTTTNFTAPVLGDAVRGLISSDKLTALPLDAVYDQITVGSWVVIDRPSPSQADPNLRTTTYRTVLGVQTVSRETINSSSAPTGFAAKVTQLSLDQNWLPDVSGLSKFLDSTDSTLLLRGTVIYAQAEEVHLAEVPIDTYVSGSTIELDGVYDGLESGRWAIVSGNRTDILNTNGVTASELVMVGGVSQETRASQTDTVHTSLTLAAPLAYTYDRSTVTISGNVAAATQGQTVGQVLGNGDASQSFQTFALSQQPLTYTSATTPAGAQSTLTVTVNEIEWQETDDLSALGPKDHAYITQTGNSGVTSVIFGNGQNGARVPTGTANVKATYRYGIGSSGNVDAGQISQLATRPLGAQSVLNPLPATGGADPDSVAQARSNTPIAVMALDRLVSVPDYAYFSRSYAGIGKAASVKLSNGRRQLVYVTIAGAEDIPIDVTSDLYRNLVASLQQFGDPHLPILVGVRTLKLLVIVAGFQVLPEYQFESVEPNIRAALLDTFSFDRRNLGQPAFLSEAVAVMQAVQGVAFVNVTVFDSVAQDASASLLTGLSSRLFLRRYVQARPASVDSSLKLPPNPTAQDLFQIRPAELVYLTPDIPDTLILTEITPTNPGPPPQLRKKRRAR
jgi:predicted phage baseplate assembly protein